MRGCRPGMGASWPAVPEDAGAGPVLNAELYGIEKDSVILLEQLRTIDKRRLKDKVCHLDDAMLDKVNHALEISLELTF